MSNCQTCLWWGAEVRRDLMDYFAGMRLCNCPKPGMSGVDHVPAPRIFHPVAVATNPDFGCIHHEAKDD